MSNSPRHRYACALLAIAVTFAVQSLWLGAMDHDAAITIAAARSA